MVRISLSLLVSVLSSRYPQYVPELITYMSTIIKWHGSNMTKLIDVKPLHLNILIGQGRMDSTLFHMAFTGRAKRIASDLCFSNNHVTSQCPKQHITIPRKHPAAAPALTCMYREQNLFNLMLPQKKRWDLCTFCPHSIFLRS